jgi:hypothetical protein
MDTPADLAFARQMAADVKRAGGRVTPHEMLLPCRDCGALTEASRNDVPDAEWTALTGWPGMAASSALAHGFGVAAVGRRIRCDEVLCGPCIDARRASRAAA